jgi:hypothetical protein
MNLTVTLENCNDQNCTQSPLDIQPFSLNKFQYSFDIGLSEPDNEQGDAGGVRVLVRANFSMMTNYYPVWIPPPGEIWYLTEQDEWYGEPPLWNPTVYLSASEPGQTSIDWYLKSGNPTVPGVIPTFTNVFHLLFRPFNRTDLACRVTLEGTVSCCDVPQPPVLVEQPYWVLLASTCSYFAVSYIWVFFMSFMDRFECWRRCCWRLKRTWCCCCWYYLNFFCQRKRKKRRSPAIRLTQQQGKEPDASMQLEQPLLDVSAEASLPGPTFQATESGAGPPTYQTMSEQSTVQSPSATPTPSEEMAFTAEMEQDDEDEEEEKQEEDRFDPDGQQILTVSERLARANAGYLFLQFCMVLGNLIYITILFNYRDNAPADSNRSRWWRYQQVYMFWNNSSQTPLLASAIASHMLLKYQLYATLKLKGLLPHFRPTCLARCCCFCCCSCCLRSWMNWRIFWFLVPENLMTKRIAWAVFFLNLPGFLTNILPMWILFFPFLLMGLIFFSLILACVYLVFWISEKGAATALQYGVRGILGVYELGKSKWQLKRAAMMAAQQKEQDGVDGMDAGIDGNGGMNSGADNQDEDLLGPGPKQEVMEEKEKEESRIEEQSVLKVVAPSPQFSSTSEYHSISEATPSISTYHSMSDDATPQVAVGVYEAPPSSPDQLIVSAATVQDSERMNFPWYAVLVLRLWTMVVIVFLMQTPFNLGYYVWDAYVPKYPSLDKNIVTLLEVWSASWQFELGNRSNNLWVAGMEASLHQYIMQIQMFV